MAKQSGSTVKTNNISRPCIHAKTKNSNNKSSKNYVKRYAGQGR